jgi:hypothetical protein
MSAIVNGVPDRVVLSLLVTLPAIRRNALLEVLSPRRLHVVMSRMYEHEVACALVRANADVVVPHGESDGILLVQTFGWRIVIAARYGDDGRQAVRDAEEAAGRLRGSAVLSVTDQQPAEDVLRYCRESQRQGRPIDAVAWTDSRHDSPLKRTLVGLFR